MLNRLGLLLRHGFAKYPVRELRGGYVYVLEDRTAGLQFMREVVTSEGKRGVVVRLDEFSSYVAMYEPVKNQSLEELELTE